MERFRDRVAVVTGGSRGIGLAIARRLSAEGAAVCITGRTAAALETAAADLGVDGADVLTVAGHVADAEHRDDVVARTLDRFGRIDVLVNNCAVNPVYGRVLDTGDDALRKVLDVNVVATIGWIRAVHERWQRAHGGSIVNVSAVAGLRPVTGIGGYGASKAALVRLTEQLAVELGPDVRVNAVAPGVVRTRFAAGLFEGRDAEVSARYPLRRLGEPDDVAALVAYLAGDDASWVTGQTVVVDGGLSLVGAVDSVGGSDRGVA